MSTPQMIPFKEARKQKGVTQREIERQLGIQQATLSRGEQGAAFSPECSEKLARFFGFPWEERHFLYPERYTEFALPQEIVSEQAANAE